MNPLARLSPALYAGLAGLAVAGVAVPVYEHSVPDTARFYVLLSAPAILASGGRPGCLMWRCEVAIQIGTHFMTDALSAVPANEIAEQVLLRLNGVALPFPEAWQCMPGQLVEGTEGTPADNTDPRVDRRLRLQWEVYCHATTPLPAPTPLAVLPVRETPGFLASLRAYFSGLF